MVVLTYVGAGNGMSPLQEMYTPLTIVFPADLPPLQDKVMLWSPGWLRAHTRAQAGLEITASTFQMLESQV